MADPAEALGMAQEPSHDYQVGVPTRWTQPWSTATVRTLTAIGALVVGFLLAAGLTAGRTAAIAQDERKDELIALVKARQARTEQLTAELESLRDRTSAAEAAASGSTPAVESAIYEAEAAAGFTPVRGAGVRVTYNDAPPPCTQAPELCRILDSDLQGAVNTLFAGGAEGVALNDERIIGTTAIRSAGQLITVNYRFVTPPYVIEAVGDPVALFEGFTTSAFGQESAALTDFGLVFSIEAVDELLLPAYTGALRIETAVPVGEDPNSKPLTDATLEAGADLPLGAGGLSVPLDGLGRE